MKKIWLLVILFILSSQNVNASPTELPSVTHYSLQIRLFPKEERLEVVARMTATNKTDQSFSELPFLLYRLLDVQKVTDDKGSPLIFNQTITRLAEGEVNNLQANLIKVQLAKPLPPGAAIDLTMSYRGSIYGYPEIMLYVKDRVSEKYSLMRPDALAYPMLAHARHESLLKAYGLDVPFTYDLAVTVPDGYVVACGGAQQNVSTREGTTTFLAYVFGIFMVANGLQHIAASIYMGQLMPGVYSSPLLLVCSIYLLLSVRYRKRVHAGNLQTVLDRSAGSALLNVSFADQVVTRHRARSTRDRWIFR